MGTLAAQLVEVNTLEVEHYSMQVSSDSTALAAAVMAKGHKLASDGTNNLLVLCDLRPYGLTGVKLKSM